MSSSTDVSSLLLDGSGNVLRPPQVVTPGGIAAPSNPGVASNGSSFLASWTDDRNGLLSRAVLATTVGLDGSVMSRAATVDALGDATAGIAPAVAAMGSDYVVAWPGWPSNSGYQQVYASVVSGAGPSSRVTVSSPSAFTPAIASSSDGSLVVWGDIRNSRTDIYASRLDATGAVLDPSGVFVGVASVAEQTDIEPAVAWTGSGYVVAWRPAAVSVRQLWAQWMSPAGTLAGNYVTVSGTQSDVDGVSVACAPLLECVLGWTSGGSTWLRRYDPSGNPLAAAEVVAGLSGPPRIAWDGTAFVVVASNAGSIYAQWMATDGTLLRGMPLDLVDGVGTAAYAVAATGGTDYLAYWSATSTMGVLFTPDVLEPPDAGLGRGDAGDASVESGPEASADTGVGDTGSGDGHDDAGVETDGGEDSGAPHADASGSPPDGSSADATLAEDGGGADGSRLDAAGPADSAAPMDAMAISDAASPQDAPGTDGSPGSEDGGGAAASGGANGAGGCGCTTAPAPDSAGVGFLFALSLLVLRRTKRARGT
jgi:MYXO-CTERM domain-containing protein